MAPTRARVRLVLTPAKIDGMACITDSFQKMSLFDAVRDRMSWIDSGSTVIRPAIVLMRRGKKEMATAITTLDVIPNPKAVMNTGASTIFGRPWKATM